MTQSNEESTTSQETNTMWAQDDYHFYGQRPNEHVLLVKHQHPIILLPIVLIGLVALLVPYGLVRFFDGAIQTYGVVIGCLVIGFYLAHHVYGYKQSVSILSNERI